MQTIGVISDTHVPSRAKEIPRAALAALDGVDMIFHAGDIVSFEALRSLEALAPVYAVAGNMDPAELRFELPLQRTIRAEGVLFGLTHGHLFSVGSEQAIRQHLGDVGCLIYGHTHRAHLARVGAITIFNPGTTVGGLESSVGIIRVDGGNFEADIVRYRQKPT